MSITINNESTRMGDPLFYDKRFRRFLETYIPFFKNSDTTIQITIPPHDVLKYRGDLFGLMDTLDIDREHHWFVMRLNGFHNPLDVPETLDSLYIPDLSKLSNLKQLFSASI